MGIEVRAPPQFRVLGPLEAWRDGEAIRLGGARQRALLGMLLLRANVLVRTEEVIEELLGAEVSPTTANAVHAAVSRLRRALGADSGLLVTRPGGYVLALDLEQLDCARFERLAADGRERLAAGDPTRAASLLREALGLWRGPPLADLAPFGVAAAEVRRLQELRLVALGERIDADLELGRAPELVAELQLLVAEHPLRERLREQLMLALYRAGRQAEALAVYRETSGRLRSELGLEPSAALRRLERMVLDQDPALGAERPARPADPIGRDGGPDPVVCPFKGLAAFDGADAEYFCGRDRVVSDLVARLAESTIVGILGPSGIGKSSLLRAGVLPALRAGALPRSAGWRQIVLRPGEHPLQELARATSWRSCSPSASARMSGRRSWSGSPTRRATPTAACSSCARCAPTCTAGSAPTRASPGCSAPATRWWAR
jgi:DNA-binding SARP family transcriptional activator